MSIPEKQLLLSKPYSVAAWGDSVRRYAGTLLLGVADYAAIVGSILTVWYLRERILPLVIDTLPPFEISHVYTFFIIPSIYLLFLAYEGLYIKRLPFVKCAERVFKIVTYVSIFFVLLLYFLKEQNVSRLFIILTWLFSFFYLVTARHFTKRFLIRFGLWEKAVVIIGAGKTAELLAKSFSEEPGMGYKIAGLIEDNIKERPLLKHYPHLGLFANAEQAIQDSGVQDAIIAVPGLERKQLLDLVYRIQPYVRNLTIVPDLFGMPLSNMEVETLFSEKTVLLKIRNNMSLTHNRVLKRTVDLVGSICGVLVISPILLGIVAAIYISNPGPIIFAHRRIGSNGKTFPCYKFRSMVVNAQSALEEYLTKNPAAREEWKKEFKLKDDPRITPIGRMLRKTSLDELPQLFNVIKGEMSLVGPRPIVQEEIIKYGDYIHDYYLVRPGMTGYWQVSGRNDVDYENRVKMDSWYVRNWSLWQDIVLLIKTINVVLARKGAY